MQTLQTHTPKRSISFITRTIRNQKTKKVGDILKELGLTTIGNGKNDMSVNHDTILYK